MRTVVTVALMSLSFSGCVYRRMTIQSDPPHALAMVDGEEVGYTPVSLDHTYYGIREIKLIKPGFETVTVMQKLETPWYQYMPFDFFAENLWPFQITDRHGFMYSMQKQRVVGNQELVERANSHRNELRNEEFSGF